MSTIDIEKLKELHARRDRHVNDGLSMNEAEELMDIDETDIYIRRLEEMVGEMWGLLNPEEQARINEEAAKVAKHFRSDD